MCLALQVSWPRWPHREQGRSRNRHGRAEQPGLREPEHHVVIAADELDEEALATREDQVDGEESTVRCVGAAATAPRRRPACERFVDRSGLDPLGRRDLAVRVAHRPREIAGNAVGPVARELAGDAPDGVPERQRGRACSEQNGELQLLAASDDKDGGCAADNTSVPGEPRAGDGVGERRVARVLGKPVEPRTTSPPSPAASMSPDAASPRLASRSSSERSTMPARTSASATVTPQLFTSSGPTSKRTGRIVTSVLCPVVDDSRGTHNPRRSGDGSCAGWLRVGIVCGHIPREEPRALSALLQQGHLE